MGHIDISKFKSCEQLMSLNEEKFILEQLGASFVIAHNEVFYPSGMNIRTLKVRQSPGYMSSVWNFPGGAGMNWNSCEWPSENSLFLLLKLVGCMI